MSHHQDKPRSTVRILPTRPKLHGFEWALKQMKAGKRVMRRGGAPYRLNNYPGGKRFEFYTDGTWHGVTNILLPEAILSNDWQLAPTEAP